MRRQAPPSHGGSAAVVCDVEGSLLRSSSCFSYFMVVALEAGSFLRALLLLFVYPLLCLLEEETRIRAMTLIAFCGVSVSSFRVGATVLPKHLLEDVGKEGFQLLTKGKKKVCVSQMPKVMVEEFLRKYLQVEMVLAREMKVAFGFYTGFMAGFRAEGSILASTVFRTGILAALRSLKMGGAAVGLMITASHNPVGDNGVKVADPSGSMMTQKWEPFADALASASTSEDLVDVVFDFVDQEKISLGGGERSEVLLARDTRPSGEFLLEAAKKGIASVIGAVAIDLGILTTPQLHWIVRRKNQGKETSEMDYFRQLSDSFRRLIDLFPEGIPKSVYDPTVIVDGANGVGGEKLLELMKLLPSEMEIRLRNSGKNGGGAMNEFVGADFVQKEKTIPRGFSTDDAGKRCASFDGDADRIVYFRIREEEEKNIELIDGDKILSLFALFIKEQLSKMEETRNGGRERKLGVVQTAYANGASTEFLKNMGIEVSFTPTGVKHLHEKASQYDVGIYFEANGHGTVLFSEEFLRELEALTFNQGSESQRAALTLWEVSRLVNQAVGDAFSGFLLAEAILRHKGWSIEDWSSLYEDLPSRQLKVKVADRNVVTTTDAETRVVNPPGLQEAIDMETARYPQGRCFIRPSGTEDVVRVYAEASTNLAAVNLARAVALKVTHFLGV